MKTGRAFELSDLTVLLELDLGEPSDAGDIEAIDASWTRRPHRQRDTHRPPVGRTSENATAWSPTPHPEPGLLRSHNPTYRPSSTPNKKGAPAMITFLGVIIFATVLAIGRPTGTTGCAPSRSTTQRRGGHRAPHEVRRRHAPTPAPRSRLLIILVRHEELSPMGNTTRRSPSTGPAHHGLRVRFAAGRAEQWNRHRAHSTCIGNLTAPFPGCDQWRTGRARRVSRPLSRRVSSSVSKHGDESDALVVERM